MNKILLPLLVFGLAAAPAAFADGCAQSQAACAAQTSCPAQTSCCASESGCPVQTTQASVAPASGAKKGAAQARIKGKAKGQGKAKLRLVAGARGGMLAMR